MKANAMIRKIQEKDVVVASQTALNYTATV